MRYRIMVMMALIGLLGCSENTDMAPGGGDMSFSLSTRASDNDVASTRTIGDEQLVRLFVVERAQEHTEVGGTESLHLERMVDLTTDSYQLTELFGQWYKFAFVCVPNVGAETGTGMFRPEGELANNHDFNKYYIDYGKALDYQAGNLNAAQGQDLAVYRKVIDRWVDAATPASEDVYLTRQTGELILDMGIPKDQFDLKYSTDAETGEVCWNGPVAYFQITMTTPTAFYVRDEARDSVIIQGESQKVFRWNVTSQSERQVIHIALLPGELKNATVAAYDKKGEIFATEKVGDADFEGAYSLTDREGKAITIKKNMRTRLLFNGMTTGEFEVRYAGFDSGNDATIDVDDDAWDGNSDL